SPPDCSKDYNFSNEVSDKNFNILSSGKKYVGFVVNGKNIVVDSLDFEIESDFTESAKQPLSINFFEEDNWKFSEFSDSFLPKNWGCYSLVGIQGPLIGNSFYCEMISIPDSGKLYVGADVSGVDVVDLNMTVYPESGTGASWDCNFDPNSEEGCLIEPDIGEIFSAGNYQVCVGADTLTGYKINQDDVGDNCGFSYASGPEGSVKDYAIFAQATKYADANFFSSDDFDKEDIVSAMNTLITERYEGDCSEGCVLPIEFSGITQNIRIHDVQLVYTRNLEWDSSDKIYDLNAIPVTVDFNGILDLGLLGFSVSKTMEYIVSLNGTELFKEDINILPTPIILLILPLNPPAGVPIEFHAGVNFSGNQSLTYKWDFGDEKTITTNVPFASHTYADLRNYTLTLEVSAGGNLTSTKTFNIETISPEMAIDANLILKKNALENVKSSIESFPFWYIGALSKVININFFESELDRLDRARNNSFNEQDFIKIAGELYALNIPTRLNINSFEVPYLMTELKDINIKSIEIISGTVNGASNNDYAKPILTWQNKNINVNYITKEFGVSFWDGKDSAIFRVYSFEVNSESDEESYFVINRPFSELYFKENIGARKVDDSTIIILEGGSDKSFEFYYESTEPTSFFVSPKLSSIVIEADIDTSCNYNLVCEEEYGENPDNCRSDCKPISRAVIYMILSLVFMLVIYAILQVWYKRRYEKYLFKDDRQLYNLLMYVTNARARGMTDLRIGADLRSKGWSSERVNYIIKKSRGDRTGLYEIIPFEKVSAYFRNRKARKLVAAKTNIATGNRQQPGRNINKSVFQRRI
ncbi:MAG: PKD domain-containing protein, partial [archaeon]